MKVTKAMAEERTGRWLYRFQSKGRTQREETIMAKVVYRFNLDMNVHYLN